MPQRFLGIDYFRGLPAHLAGRHMAVFPRVSPLASIEERADQLADAIHEACPTGPIHIIAHSMGGLDSRSLIARNLRGLAEPGRVASLTTLSTPHRGSPVADLLVGGERKAASALIRRAAISILQRFAISTGALANLTSDSASQVPDPTLTHGHIRYRSYVATGRSARRPTCWALALTHRYIREVTGQENDGLVAVESARFGDVREPFWPCDHIDVVGHNLDTADLGHFQFDHFAAFDAIIREIEGEHV